MGLGNTGQTCCQGERNGQAVRHSDYDVPDGFRGSKVLFNVWRLRHLSLLLDGHLTQGAANER